MIDTESGMSYGRQRASVLIPALFERYLEILGIESGEPSAGLLAELVSAQLVAAPFVVDRCHP